MSTLGRKAMKKTLERLKEDALSNTRQCADFVKVLFRKLEEERGKMDEDTQSLFALLLNFSGDAVLSLLRYIQALEDYGYELDEEWDKLLKSIEEAQQPKPTQKKEEAKKTSYIK